MVAVNRIGLTGRAHFIENLKQPLAVFDRVPDGPCAVSVLNKAVRRRHSAGVFHKYTVRHELSSVAGVGPGGRTPARLDLNWDQLIGSVHEVIRFPTETIRGGTPMDARRCDDGRCPGRRCGHPECRFSGVARGRSPIRAEQVEIRRREAQRQMSLEPEGKNPDQDQTQGTDKHHKASHRVLLAGRAQVVVVGFVVPEASRTLFSERRWTAPLAQMPCFTAIAPCPNLGSGYKATIAQHDAVALVSLHGQ